jgi:phosphoserine phosphatase RsbU/P
MKRQRFCGIQLAAAQSVNLQVQQMVQEQKVECSFTAKRPFGCMELWAGNEKAHRGLLLAGLQGDVIAVPSGAESGGDLAAVFSCTDDVARVVLADCVGHGYEASAVARHVHHLLHKFRDIRDTSGLLEALNDEFTLATEGQEGPLRLTTVVTGTFDGRTGVFTFAYAAHPRMFLWREAQQLLTEIGEGLENLPLGFITGEKYLEQSVRLGPGDAILAFSDGATEVESPEGEQLTAAGLSRLAQSVAASLPHPLVLADFSAALLNAIKNYHGAHLELADDITLLTMRRVVS